MRRRGANTKPRSREALDALLRQHGLRSTMARVTVLRLLSASRGPTTHGEIAEALADDGLDRATVYRNLMDLVGAGIAVRSDLGDHVWRFELRGRAGGAGDEAEHAHFICTDCGTVTCLPDDAVHLVASRAAPRAIAKRQVAVQIKGRCDACS